MLRSLSLQLRGEPETQLPLTREEDLIKTDDVLDLSELAILSCTSGPGMQALLCESPAVVWEDVQHAVCTAADPGPCPGQCWPAEGPVRARLTDENNTGLSAVVD